MSTYAFCQPSGVISIFFYTNHIFCVNMGSFVYMSLKPHNKVFSSNLSVYTHMTLLFSLCVMLTFFPPSYEPQMFKQHFEFWDEILAVDYTRTAEVVISRMLKQYGPQGPGSRHGSRHSSPCRSGGQG